MIYFDNAATYFNRHDDVLKVFLDASKEYFANPSSTHRLGHLANRAYQKAAQDVLQAFHLNSQEYEVIFNSGASEGINHAIKGYAYRNKARGKEIIAFKNEHPAVLEALKSLALEHFVVHYIDTDNNGEIQYEEIKKHLNQNTIMVVVMSVNNEVGSVNDLGKVRALLKSYPKCVLFSDVTQSVGKCEMDYSSLDMFTCSAHKFGGLLGSGILIKKKKILLTKLIDGGAQQNNLRSGSVPLPLILSTVYALQKAMKNLKHNYQIVSKLHQCLLKLLQDEPEIMINGNSDFPYIVSFSLHSKKASVVIEALSEKEIYVSSQSACHAKSDIPSATVFNITHDEKRAKNTIRVSFSEINTSEEVETFVRELKAILGEIR
ncbi:MAG: aminotransferase class V-fold PLP-dependent enzyme [Bacilli bacterium]|nr:aminotransferase class V-fold PLP-dependent enzyme [Bacilli bacterium]